MKEVVTSGKTVEEAIEKALAELNVPREEAEVDVVEIPTKGILGIMGKDAVVKVRLLFDPATFAEKWLQEFLDKAEMPGRVHSHMEEGVVLASISGDKAGPLIGRHGQTLDSLQYVLTLTLNKKTESYVPVVLDVGDYRKNRNETVEKMAEQAAQKAVETGEKVILSAMSSAERRLVHLALSENKQVKTYSTGEEPRRQVVVEKV